MYAEIPYNEMSHVHCINPEDRKNKYIDSEEYYQRQNENLSTQSMAGNTEHSTKYRNNS